MDKKRKYHDMLKILRRFHALMGDYDGYQIVRNQYQHFRARLVVTFLMLHWVKYAAQLFFPKDSLVQFYLADAANSETPSNHRYVSGVCCIYIGWGIVAHLCFLRLNHNDRNSFWLQLIPHPLNLNLTSGKLPGAKDKELRFIRIIFNASGRWIVRALLLLALLMSSLMNYTYYDGFASRQSQLPYFWPVLVFNMLAMWLVMTHSFFITTLPSLAYAYLSHLQWIRFRNVSRALDRIHLQCLSSSAVVTSSTGAKSTVHGQIAKVVRQFNLIVSDTLKLNFFWSFFFGWNFFFSMFLLFFFVLEIAYGQMLYLRLGFGIMMIFVYINCLLIPNFWSSHVHSKVRAFHLTNPCWLIRLITFCFSFSAP
jgi:hypothetical protein